MLLGTFPRDLFYSFYFLLFLSLMFSYLLKNLIYANLLTITQFSLVEIISQQFVKYCLTIRLINVKESDHVELLEITIDKHLSSI